MRVSRARQAIFGAAMRVPRRGAVGSLSFEVLMRLVQAGDSHTKLVEYDLHGERLLIPAGHDLPRFRRYSSGYGANLGRAAALVHAKYDDATAVDIGANVGDTALEIRRGGPIPVLCVEGDRRFAALLRHNLRGLDSVEVEEVYVGPQDEARRVRRRFAHGTGWTEPGAGQPIRFAALGSVLARHARFSRPRLIKVDTDGLDCPILIAAADLLAELRPVLFFEYAPDMYPDPAEAFAVFGALEKAGYRETVCYLNHGEYLASPALADGELLEDLHSHVSGHSSPGEPSPRYLDVCAFHEDDEDLRGALRAAALADR